MVVTGTQEHARQHLMDLEILKWAIVSGCSMEDADYYEAFNLCESAADMGYWDIVKLAWDHGCSCSDRIKLQYTQHQFTATDVQS